MSKLRPVIAALAVAAALAAGAVGARPAAAMPNIDCDQTWDMAHHYSELGYVAYEVFHNAQLASYYWGRSDQLINSYRQYCL